MRESKVETELRKGVEALGGTCEKFSSQGQIGRPDRLVNWPRGNANCIVGWVSTKLQREDGSAVGGYIMFQQPMTEYVETKAPDGKVKSWQARDHERRRKMGFVVHVLYTLEQVEAYLRQRGKR